MTPPHERERRRIVIRPRIVFPLSLLAVTVACLAWAIRNAGAMSRTLPPDVTWGRTTLMLPWAGILACLSALTADLIAETLSYITIRTETTTPPVDSPP